MSEQILPLIHENLIELKNYFELPNEGIAFNYWIAFNYNLSNDIPTEFLIVDGSSDKGIDAIWVDENKEEFVILQAKWSRSGSTIYGDTPIQKLMSASKLLEDSKRCEELKPEISEASDKYCTYVCEEKYKTKYIFAHTGKLSLQAEEEIKNIQLKHDLLILDANALYLLWQDRKKKKIDNIKLNIRNKEFFKTNKDEYNSCIVTIDANSLKEQIRHNYGIFDENVRGFLGFRKNSPNYDMKHTIENHPDKFWLYNNGITITCSKFLINENNIDIINPQIVNGCQTTTVITKSDNLENVFVLARIHIIDPNTDDIIKITEATNKQSSVVDRDFKSKDERQNVIFEFFKSFNYFYDYRRGSWDHLSKDERKKYMRADNIDVFKSVLSYLSCPAEAKNKRRLLFLSGNSGYYDKIIKLNPQLFLLSYSVYNFINEQKKLFNKKQGVLFSDIDDDRIKIEKQKANIFISHSIEHFTYAIMSLLENYYGNLNNIDATILKSILDNDNIFSNCYTFVIYRIKDATKHDRESGKDERSIFIDPNTAEKIKQCLDERIDEIKLNEKMTYEQYFEEKIIGS
jgi:hypothetical protein